MVEIVFFAISPEKFDSFLKFLKLFSLDWVFDVFGKDTKIIIIIRNVIPLQISQ